MASLDDNAAGRSSSEGINLGKGAGASHRPLIAIIKLDGRTSMSSHKFYLAVTVNISDELVHGVEVVVAGTVVRTASCM